MTKHAEEMTVGVIGGMGPYATLAFFKSVLDNTPAHKDWDHLRIIIDNNPKIPSRTRAFLFGEDDPVPMMIESAKTLGVAGADFVVLPCNSAHYFLPRVRGSVDVPFIDMVDETCKAVIAVGAIKVGLLAGEVTVRGRLYERRLEGHSIDVLQVSEEQQVLVRSIIEDGKKNAVCDLTRGNMQSLISELEERGADAIVLGCTELPMAMEGIVTRCVIIDSLDVLAKAVVQEAKYRVEATAKLARVR